MFFPLRHWPSTLHRTFRIFRRGLATDSTSFLELPPHAEWLKKFPKTPVTKLRASVRDPDTAAKLANAFIPKGSQDKVIIEAYPGPGQLSRAILNLPKSRVRKLIILEDYEPYLQYLLPLQKADPRVTVLSQNGHEWSTYNMISEMGLFSGVEKLDWNQGVHPHLQFVTHVPSSVSGEQLIAQFFRSVPDRQWLFQYGRIPLSFILSEHMFQRITAPVTSYARCKVTLIAEATAECEPALPFEDHQPYNVHFHPSSGSERVKGSRALGLPFQSMNVVPLEKPYIGKGHLDAWDYCLRRLFVRKSTEVRKAIPDLAPGAGVLVKKVTGPDLAATDQLDVKKKVSKLTPREWSILIKAFEEWPFKPDHYSIEEIGSQRHSERRA